MPHIKHIVFPVDFSERCNEAVPFVAEMARRHDAQLTLLAVAHPHYMEGLEGSPLIDPQVILDGVKSQLDESFLSDFAGLQVNRIALLGEPARAITDFVTANQVSLVMMPTHGYGPFRQLLLGSIAAKVLHDVHAPVWTTAHTNQAPDREHIALRKLLCAVDASPACVELNALGGRVGERYGRDLAAGACGARHRSVAGTEYGSRARRNASRECAAHNPRSGAGRRHRSSGLRGRGGGAGRSPRRSAATSQRSHRDRTRRSARNPGAFADALLRDHPSRTVSGIECLKSRFSATPAAFPASPECCSCDQPCGRSRSSVPYRYKSPV